MRIVRLTSSYQEPYPLQIVGEQSYRGEIEEVTGYTGEPEGIDADDFIAQLILDDNNFHDPGNAVAVEINGKTVGYLSKSDAKRYRRRLEEIGLGDVVGECHAGIRGGFERKDGTLADFGIRLDILLDNFKLYVPPPPKPVEHAQPGISQNVTTTKPVDYMAVALDWLKWAFARNRWWKTLLVLFFGVPILCGMLQGLLEIILGK